MNGHTELNPKGNPRRNTAIGFVIGLMFGGLVDLYTGDLGFATVGGMVLGSLIGYFGAPHIHLMEYPPGVLPRLVFAVALFTLSLTGSVLLLEHATSETVQLILASATAISGLLLIIAIGYALSTLDEMQRRIQVEALAIGFGISVLVTLTNGLLGLGGVRQPSLLVVPGIMVFSWLIGKVWTRWKYR